MDTGIDTGSDTARTDGDSAPAPNERCLPGMLRSVREVYCAQKHLSKITASVCPILLFGFRAAGAVCRS